jgi:hypothetical protein
VTNRHIAEALHLSPQRVSVLQRDATSDLARSLSRQVAGQLGEAREGRAACPLPGHLLPAAQPLEGNERAESPVFVNQIAGSAPEAGRLASTIQDVAVGR